MDLLSNLNDAKWTNAPADKVSGFIEYTLLKGKMLEPGRFEYALKSNASDGTLCIGVLEGGQGKYNPLSQARNVEMKISEGKIVAINLDGDCVVLK
jgi:hypothetical protein